MSGPDQITMLPMLNVGVKVPSTANNRLQSAHPACTVTARKVCDRVEGTPPPSLLYQAILLCAPLTVDQLKGNESK